MIIFLRPLHTSTARPLDKCAIFYEIKFTLGRYQTVSETHISISEERRFFQEVGEELICVLRAGSDDVKVGSKPKPEDCWIYVDVSKQLIIKLCN
jgi:hypothetical protein